jgi:hypothetical protein
MVARNASRSLAAASCHPVIAGRDAARSRARSRTAVRLISGCGHSCDVRARSRSRSWVSLQDGSGCAEQRVLSLIDAPTGAGRGGLGGGVAGKASLALVQKASGTRVWQDIDAEVISPSWTTSMGTGTTAPASAAPGWLRCIRCSATPPCATPSTPS